MTGDPTPTPDWAVRAQLEGFARVDALHQPTLVMSTRPCPAHTPPRLNALRESRACTGCQHSPVMSCMHSKCCEFPCPTHLALFDETPESCTHG